MLTESEKDKIRLEEVYRAEARAKLQPSEPRKPEVPKLLQFLSNGFVLWMLSAIFITYGAKQYESYKASLADQAKTKEAIERLNLEISYRMCRILVELYLLTDRSKDNEKLAKEHTAEDVKKIVYYLKQVDGTGGVYLNPEYAKWGIIGLIAEEKRNLLHVNGQDEQLNRVLENLTGIEVFFEVRKTDFADVRRVAGMIEDELILPDWKQNSFYFFDGSSRSPFP